MWYQLVLYGMAGFVRLTGALWQSFGACRQFAEAVTVQTHLHTVCLGVAWTLGK
jgi:hypothetical protein